MMSSKWLAEFLRRKKNSDTLALLTAILINLTLICQSSTKLIMPSPPITLLNAKRLSQYIKLFQKPLKASNSHHNNKSHIIKALLPGNLTRSMRIVL